MIRNFNFSPFLAAAIAVVLYQPCLAETLLINNALLITMKPGQEKPFIGYMLVGDDGRIAAVGAGKAPGSVTAGKVIDAAGKFVAPGFVSSHSHLGSAPFRGLGTTETLYGWGLATQRFSRFTTADDAYWFSLSGAYEFLRNGITTVYDFASGVSTGGTTVGVNVKVPPAKLKPGPFDENQLKAKMDAGIRCIDSVALAPVGTRADIIARLEKFIAYSKTNYGSNPLLLKLAISGGVQRAPTKDTAELEAYVMKTYGLLNESHFLESPEQLLEQRAKFQWYVDAGALGPNFIFGHFIHATPEMVGIAAKAGASMSWQPMSNSRLASGVADIPAFRAFGMKVGVGLDSNACCDTCDPFENLRTGLALIRTKYENAKVLSVYDMLYLHTMGSADVMGVADKVGSLEPGKFADFLIVDPRSPQTGPIHDAVATYVLACGLRNLKQVYVGGKLVAEGLAIVGQDEDHVSSEIDVRMTRIVAEADAADQKSASLLRTQAMPALAVR
jgi:5-methylthioadenosine/S-adenosylhomocysteine deaminase